MRKLFLIIFAFLFTPQITFASDLILPVSISSGADIPVAPVTYNDVTYNNSFTFINLINSSYFVEGVYFLPTEEAVASDFRTTTNAAGDVSLLIKPSVLEGRTHLYCYGSGSSYPVSFNNCSISSSNISNTFSYSAYEHLFFRSDLNLYDSTGTNVIIYPDQNSAWYGNNQLDGSRIVFISPTFNPIEISGIQTLYDFQFEDNTVSRDIELKFSNPDGLAVPKLVLQDTISSTELDEFSAVAPGTSINGYIEFTGMDSNGDYLFTLHFPGNVVGNYGVFWKTTDDWFVTSELISIGTTKGIDLNGNQTEVNSFCDSVPHEFAIGLTTWTFDTHGDDICKLVIPPDNYFPTIIGGTFSRLGSKFAFVGQTITAGKGFLASTDTASSAPSFVFGSMYGSGQQTFDLADVSPAMVGIKELLNIILWIVFLRWLYMSFIMNLFNPTPVYESIEN